jgi:hypothetical protein
MADRGGIDMKEIVVTGGRDYNDWETVQKILNLFDPTLIIQGGATGADALAVKYASFYGKNWITVKADWNKYGKRAGPVRNREMIEAYPGAIIVAFPGGRGTADCVDAAVKRNRIVLRVCK